MNTTTFASVENIVNNLTKGTFGIEIIAVTSPKMSKSRRSDKAVNPFYGRVHKCTYLFNAAVGYGYGSNVNKALKRNGIDAKFDESKPNGKHWINYPLTLQSDKDESQHYLRLTTRKSMKSVSIYLIDGKPCTNKEELAKLEEWLPKHYESKKQAALGLSEEEQVSVFDYKVESIIMVKQGDKVYNKLDRMFNPIEIKAFFGK